MLPHDKEQLAAETFSTGFAVADDAAIAAQDGDAHPAQDRFQVLVATENAAAWLADTVNTADHALAVGTVLQIDAQDLFLFLVLGWRLKNDSALLIGGHLADLVIEDDTFILEHVSNVLFELGARHIHGGRLNPIRVPN